MRRALQILLCLSAGVAAPSLGVTLTSDVVYAQGATQANSGGGTTDLILDVYSPDTPGTGRPALLLVHGGSFTSGDKTSGELVLSAHYFASRGWVCFSINYRLVGDDPPAPWWIELLNNPTVSTAYAATTDTKRAIRWIRSQAATYGIDPHRLAAIGHSAGAYCVLMAAISDEDDFANDAGTATPDQNPAYSGKVNACLEVSGGDGAQTNEYDSADPPLMIWHGDADTVVNYAEAEAVAQECLDHQIPHRFYTAAGQEHGAPTWFTTIEGRTINEHALEFFDRFFAATLTLAHSPSGPALHWPSVSNAVYDVMSGGPPGTVVESGVTADGEMTTLPLPAPLPSTASLHLRIQSGQP